MQGTLQAEVSQVKEQVDAGYALPSSWYTDPQIFAAERSRIFRKHWLYFGHVAKVSEPGSYTTRTASGFPVVVTRDEDGELRGFLNVCRHRLHPVAIGCGKAKALQCHYHGWSYGLDGRLKGMPRSTEAFAQDGVGFVKEEFGLVPVAVETWGPLIFFNLDPDAPSLMDALGELPGLADIRGVNFSTVPRGVDEEQVNCNWKTLVDNVIECYHCPTVHPTFSEVYDTSAKAVEITTMRGACALAFPARDKAVAQQAGDADFAYHAYFFPPNFYLSARAHESYFLLVTEPVDATHSIMHSEFILPESLTEEQVREVMDGAAIVNAEDMAVSASVQVGHEIGSMPLGYLMPQSEAPLRGFASYVCDALAGEEADATVEETPARAGAGSA
ncbi:MAG: aromatic ring-hydroxylating dioxygenase subunit alpha [Actinobacteria bacterium]|nr:aromatic ring-hydroxylating dioxygenase subunit alpha [Actinomycetota bacterium]